jgi:hypothetical protein
MMGYILITWTRYKKFNYPLFFIKDRPDLRKTMIKIIFAVGFF